LLAGWPLDRYPVGLTVSVRSPRLEPLAGRNVTLTVSANLENGRGKLAPKQYRRRVLSTGEVLLDLPLHAFRAADKTSPSFDVGFVRCDLDVQVSGGVRMAGKAVSYLYARDSRALIVVGPGDGRARLLAQRPLDPKSPEEQLGNGRKVLENANRARAAARFTFCTDVEFLKRLSAGEELPPVLVLHEMPAGFWTPAVVDRLEKAVRGGLHLVVIGPPATPRAGSDLARLLPGFARPDERSTTPMPRLADRTPVLHLVFDHGRWGKFETTPGVLEVDKVRKVPDAVDIQMRAANRLLSELKTADGAQVFHSRLHRVSGTRRLAYTPHPEDRALLRIAPELKAEDSLIDTIFPSAIDMRLASLFLGHMPALLTPAEAADAGLSGVAAVGTAPEGEPGFLPNHAVVTFVGNLPQPGPDILPAGGVRYKLNGGSPRLARRMPVGVVPRLLLRGITMAVVPVTLPSYDAGNAEMTQPGKWPREGGDRLTPFQVPPPDALKAGLTQLSALHAGSGSWLEPAQPARLVRVSPTDPFAVPALNLESSTINADADAIGSKIARQLKPLFASPRASMVLVTTEHGRFLDERDGPGLSLDKFTGPLDSILPVEQHQAAPRRFSPLKGNDEFNKAARTTYMGVVDLSTLGRVSPIPLALGGRLGRGAVLCLGYSPFETAERWWTRPEEGIRASDDPAVSDAHGPEVLISVAGFAGRLRATPAERPVLHAIQETDARGGLTLTVHYTDDHARNERFWSPRLHAGGRECPLTVRWVDAPGRLVHLDLSPKDAAILCPGDRPVRAALATIGGPDVTTQFSLHPPRKGEWIGLSSLESLRSLASFSGGSTDAEQPATPRRTARPILLLVLLTAVLLLTLVRGRGRWAAWWRRMRPRRKAELPDRVSLRGLADVHGMGQERPRGGRQGDVDHVTLMLPGDQFKYITLQELLRFLIGAVPIPMVPRRIQRRAAQLGLLVNVGPSMRACRDRHGYPQLRFAGQVAQLVAELYWVIGAEVNLTLVGLAGGAQSYGPFHVAGREGEIAELVEEAAQLPAAAPTVEGLPEVAPGTTAVWISDFLLERDLPALLSWGAGLADEEGRLIGLLVTVPEEDDLVGFGIAGRPFAVLNRIGATRADVRKARTDSAERVGQLFVDMGLPFAVMAGWMDPDALVEALAEAGALGPG
jgi:hypothetical protein